MSAYNWDLGIKVPVKTQKCSDNYQNMRIMLAIVRLKMRESQIIQKLIQHNLWKPIRLPLVTSFPRWQRVMFVKFPNLILLGKITSSSQQKCLKSRTEKLEVFSWTWLLQTLRAEEGLDERLAVGIGITLRGDEAGEDGRAGDEGRNVSERRKKDFHRLLYIMREFFRTFQWGKSTKHYSSILVPFIGKFFSYRK